MERRDFLRYSMAAGGLMALTTANAQSQESSLSPPTKEGMKYATLGRTGINLSILGVGCAPLGQTYSNQQAADEVLHRAVELGVTYIDTAPNYAKAEERMGNVMREVRDKIFLATKTEERSYAGTWKLIRQSLKRMNTDHIDLIYVHNWGFEERFPDMNYALGNKGALGALREARRQGVIRFIGASGHLHPSRFHKILDTGEIDVLMNAVNFISQHTYDFEHKVWARAQQENIGLVAMKVLGGSNSEAGHRIPGEYYKQAIRYCLSLPGVTTANVGMKSVSELEQCVQVVKEFKPLSAEEAYELSGVGLKLAQTDEWKLSYGEPLT